MWVLSTTTPSCHAVNRCVAIETSMSIPGTLLEAGFCLTTTSRRHSADGSRTRRTRTSIVASGSACARTILSGEDAGDDTAQTETIARTAAAATSRKRMIPLPARNASSTRVTLSTAGRTVSVRTASFSQSQCATRRRTNSRSRFRGGSGMLCEQIYPARCPSRAPFSLIVRRRRRAQQACNPHARSEVDSPLGQETPGRRGRPCLPGQAEEICLDPAFCDPPILEPIESHRCPGDRLPGGRDAHELTEMGAPKSEAFDDAVSLSDEFLDRLDKVREGRPDRGRDLVAPLRAFDRGHVRKVQGEHARHEFVAA